MSDNTSWRTACNADQILPDTGVAVLIDGKQIAVFRLSVSDAVFAIGNHDPASGANVLSRGIVCSLGETLCVASPIYKHHYCLETGACIEDPDLCVPVYPARIIKGHVEICIPQNMEQAA